MRSTGNEGLRRHAGVVVALVSFAAVMVASTTSPHAERMQIAHVRIHDIAFLPQTLTVSPGTTVEWTNDDDMAHTVTSGSDRDDDAWQSSPLIPPGGTFRVAFAKPGTYRYFCKPHVFSAAMHARIVVSGGAAGAAAQQPRSQAYSKNS